MKFALTLKTIVLAALLHALVLLIWQPMFAQQQQNRWLFVGHNDNNSTSYVERSALSQTGNRRKTWSKEVYSDGSYKLIQAEWQCREQRFRLLQGINYAATGTPLSREEGSAQWLTVVPDSVSEKHYKVICAAVDDTAAPAPAVAPDAKLFARVVARIALVREDHAANSSVLRRVTTGTKLVLTTAAPTQGWYEVLLPGTNSRTGWLHTDTIEIVRPVKPQPTTQRRPRTVTGRTPRA